MLFRSLLDTLIGRRSSRRSRRAAPSPWTNRLDLESLEDRLVPAASITIADATIVEGNAGTTNVLLQVSVSEPHSNAVSVNYTTVNGSALAGSDYDAVSGTLTFKKNEMTKTISVPVRGDNLAEGTESFTVQLSNGKTAWIADGSATVRITDDDPRISVSDRSASEGNSGATEYKFTVSLSAASNQTVTVDYTTNNGTATAGSDYVATNGTVTFLPGQPTSQEITVVVNGDHTPEDNENFTLNLSNASSNAQISDGVGDGTINDDEPRISVGNWSAYEGNSGATEFKFTVSLSGAYDETVTVAFDTANGSATTVGNDYVATNRILTFEPNQPTSQEITVLVNGDLDVESDEYFTVNLSNASSNAQISNGVGYGTIYDDEPRITIYDGYQEYAYSSYVVFTVNLSVAPVEGPVTVDFMTWDGTAYAWTDYVPTAGTLTFDIGQTTQYIYVELLNTNYTDAYFWVQLSNASANVQLANEWAAGYWYYDYYYYYDPGYGYGDYYYYYGYY